MYNVDYFIKRFQRIPEDQWTICTQWDENTGRRCALGHLATKVWYCGGNGHETKEGKALIKLMAKVGYTPHSGRYITEVNNSISKYYPQDTPKKRVLVMLNEIKAMQNKDKFVEVDKMISEIKEPIKQKEVCTM